MTADNGDGASVAVEPAYHSAPEFYRTDGPLVADLCAAADFTPDPEQAEALDVLFGVDRAEKCTTFEFCLICARQQMKTGVFKQAALGWLFVWDAPLVVWSAHEFDTAKRAHIDMATMIENTPVLSKRLKYNGIHSSAADRSINLKSGSELIFKARTLTGGRGLSAPKVILDEAFALKKDHMGALMPTMSVQPDPQIIYGSSAGLEQSAVLRAIRDRGRTGRTGGSEGLAYTEYCAPGSWDDPGCVREDCTHAVGSEGCALDRIENWRAANPLLGRTRSNGTGLTVQYVKREREAMPDPREFGRERLGWWDDPLGDLQPISIEAWNALAIDGNVDGTPQFFIDCSPNLKSAAIAGAVLASGVPYVKLADHRPGTGWLVDRLKELKAKYPSAHWQYQADGPASALKEDFIEAGIRIEKPFTGQDVARGCAHLQNLVANGNIAHPGEDSVSQALASAVKRDIGDPGLWSWGRRKSWGDISPLVAVTGAAWLLELQPAYDLLSSVLVV